jgi:hypothetical protein
MSAIQREGLVAKHSSHVLEMARKGAEHRLEELKAEMASLVKAFPHLARRGARRLSRGSAGLVSAANEGLKIAAGRKKRSRMSAAARKAVSARMKKYWAARRAAKKA